MLPSVFCEGRDNPSNYWIERSMETPRLDYVASNSRRWE